jgi:hypothetical protein
MGGGVTDRLREQDEKVMSINGGETSTDETYVNLKTQMWWNARELFAAGRVSILNDPLLIRQLGAVKMEYRSNGKIITESKEDLKKRLGRSPDRADAFIMMLWGANFIRDPSRDFSRANSGILDNQGSNPYGWNYHDGVKEEYIYGRYSRPS